MAKQIRPKNEASIKALAIPKQPLKAPIAPISLISPPPRASFLIKAEQKIASPQEPKNPTLAPVIELVNLLSKSPLKAGFIKQTASPKKISPIDKISGMVKVFKSIKETIIKIYKQKRAQKVQAVKPKLQKNKVVKAAVKNSTAGYWGEIFSLQFLHLAPNIR